MRLILVIGIVAVGVVLMVAGAWWMADRGSGPTAAPISATATYPTVRAGQTEHELRDRLGRPTMAVEHGGVTGWIWKAADGALFIGFLDGRATSKALCPATSLAEDECIRALANGDRVGHTLG
jgi:hypothetical protein